MTVVGADGLARPQWAAVDPLLMEYYDTEWGVPIRDERGLYERICLEGFQAGLSWSTILRKRPNFRVAFADFDPDVVATYTEIDVERLLGDAGIIRHRGKIESTINNARRALDLRGEKGSLAAYFWEWVPGAGQRPRRITRKALRAMTTSESSIALSRDLRRRGWTFVGPTTLYAFMQAMGLVNDHLVGCPTRDECERERKALERP